MSARPVRFIVLTRYRSGSNLLSRAIGEHPDARTPYEPFNLDRMSRRPERYLGSAFVDEFCRGPSDERVVGLKLMYGQTTPLELVPSSWGPNISAEIAGRIERLRAFMDANGVSSWAHLEDQLVRERSIRVVHLIRWNQLDAYVSFQIAMIERRWHGEPYEMGRAALHLDLDDLAAWLETGARQRRHYADRFSDHPCIEVAYEDLTADFAGALGRIGCFLELEGLEQQRPPIAKQQTRAVREIVSNYDDARRRFAGTPWAAYFEGGRA